MTVRYVDGTNGNNSWNGLSPVFTGGTTGPKATLNGAEDTPVTPGDIVWVRPGTYRETLTIDVSGTFGNPIEYRGDYSGIIWANPNGNVARITGSDDDKTAVRANCVVASGKSYRTFRGFQMDITSSLIMDLTSPQNWIIDKCYFDGTNANSPIQVTGASQLSCTVSNCYIIPNRGGAGITFSNNPVIRDIGHNVNNCIFTGFGTTLTSGLVVARVGVVSVQNCLFIRLDTGVNITAALPTGTSQAITVNGCIVDSCRTGMSATATGEIIENANNFWNCATSRSNVATGASSLTLPPLYDSRWFFQTVNAGSGPYNPLQVVTPFDLSSQSTLVTASGTNPTTTDMRGTTSSNLASRTMGILQIDPTLSIKARQGGMVDGGMILS